MGVQSVIEIRGDEWASGPLLIARDRRRRRLGLKPLPGWHGLILGARSIHTFGMKGPIGAIAIDRFGMVVGSRVVAPRRVWTVWSASAIIEVAVCDPLPPRGTMLTASRRRRAVNGMKWSPMPQEIWNLVSDA